jgi:hypothetical protein
MADPEREQFALIMAIMLAGSLTATVPLIGRLLDEGRWMPPSPQIILAFALAAVASYILFADSRSGSYFETDHALPEIFVPLGIALLASAQLGRLSAATDGSRRAWSWGIAGAGLVSLALVAMTVSKIAGGAMGMYPLDSPLTFGVLAMASAYALAAILLRVSSRRR